MKEYNFKNYTILVFRNRPFLAKLMNPDFKFYRFLNYVYFIGIIIVIINIIMT